jgi:hypothetical protein
MDFRLKQADEAFAALSDGGEIKYQQWHQKT